MLQRLSKLYQLNNWTEENAVFLGEWIFDNYKFDSLDDVIACLSNPPLTESKQWRLTPDTIREWMAIQLEKTAITRENEHERNKEKSKEELEVVDYESFKNRIAKEGLPKKQKGFQDENYQRFRDEYLTQKNERAASNESPSNEVDKPEAEKPNGSNLE